MNDSISKASTVHYGNPLSEPERVTTCTFSTSAEAFNLVKSTQLFSTYLN